MFLCFDGDEVHGAYTEFGLVNGHVHGNVVEGFWYEGGGGSDTCLYGPFSWTLSDDGNSFSGWWSCIEGEVQFIWSETKTASSLSTNMENCAVLAHDKDFQGSYVNVDYYSDSFDLCIDADEYSGSYVYGGNNINTPGYEIGLVHLAEHGEEIGSGVWFESTASGISLVFRLSDGSLGNFWWEYDDEGEIDTVADFGTLHGYDIYRHLDSTTSGECSENSFLANGESSSSASTIAATCLFVIVLAFIQLQNILINFLSFFKKKKKKKKKNLNRKNTSLKFSNQ
eukprot:TRINITY_DN11406_c0_g1_i2.p1 TRINITY_DN11406_c0_g1~~TRINITY_DN11406_c0_g1_i2.p1  ORF type:complete len:299 (+),score=29.85 TRINITY_DN11406_c0_g1_i2:49-897(+)